MDENDRQNPADSGLQERTEFQSQKNDRRDAEIMSVSLTWYFV